MSWRYKGGLVLIFSVVFLWVTSGEITQAVFVYYKQPFVVSFLETSLFVVYLPLSCMKDLLMKFIRSCCCKGGDNDGENGGENVDNLSESSDSPIKYERVCDSFEVEQKEALDSQDSSEELHSYIETKPFVSKCEESCENLEQERKLMTTKETATFGFYMSPLWFLTEYLTNAALARTSVARVTLLSATSGPFTLLIGVCLGEGSLTAVKVISVVVSMAGVAMTTLGKTWAADGSQNGRYSQLGDLFAILSSVTSGLFTVLLKKFAGEEGEKIDIQKLLGYIGLFTLVTLWWLIWPLTAMDIEPKFKFPPTEKVNELILVNGFVGSVVPDYFWALGVVWTSPLVAALGALLTIPLAMLEDIVIHGQHYSAIYIFGSIQVFLGFVIINVSDWLSLKLGW